MNEMLTLLNLNTESFTPDEHESVRMINKCVRFTNEHAPEGSHKEKFAFFLGALHHSLSQLLENI